MLLPCPRQYAKCFTYFISFNSCDNPRKKLMPRNLNSSLPQIEQGWDLNVSCLTLRFCIQNAHIR